MTTMIYHSGTGTLLNVETSVFVDIPEDVDDAEQWIEETKPVTRPIVVNGEGTADLSSFSMTDEETKLLGELARIGYQSYIGLEKITKGLVAHSESVWTKVEEVITGLENR